MNEDTRKLLEECGSGCKMALESIGQIEGYTKDEKLLSLLDSYKGKHERLEDEISKILENAGEEEKEPGVIAATMSWFSTEIKLMMKADNHKIAKLMMDGCNMGIQSVSEYQNKYSNADDKALSIARKLVKIEEDFMAEMKQFL